MTRRHNESTRRVASYLSTLGLIALAFTATVVGEGFEVVGRSSDQTIVADSQIRVTEDDGVRTMTITPAEGQGGVTIITLSIRMNDAEMPLSVSSQPVTEPAVESDDTSTATTDDETDPIAEQQGEVSVSDPAGSFLSVQVLSGGRMLLVLNADPDLEYVVEASEDMAQWETIRSGSTGNGVVEIIDEDAVNHVKRFYRARMN